jgi:AcrR family transcriptional regulator
MLQEGEPMPEPRPLRADAAKNRERILQAANRQIIARGTEVPMEAIAEDAGVAVGTLYRHFPTKNDLVGAVVNSYMEQMAREAEEAAANVEAGGRAFDQLTFFARMVMETAADNKAVKAAARALGTEYDLSESMERAGAAIQRLSGAGKAAGDLRPDLTIEDFHLFFSTVPIDQPARVRDRWFDLMMDGFCAVQTKRPAATGRPRGRRG